jgi:hypothetical protein
VYTFAVGVEGLRDDVTELLELLRLCSGGVRRLLVAVMLLTFDCSEYER